MPIQEPSHCESELGTAEENRLVTLHGGAVIFDLEGLNDQALKIGIKDKGRAATGKADLFGEGSLKRWFQGEAEELVFRIKILPRDCSGDGRANDLTKLLDIFGFAGEVG